MCSLSSIWWGIYICDGQYLWLSADSRYSRCSGSADGTQYQIARRMLSEYQILGEHILHQMWINLPVMIHYFDVQNNISAFICFSIIFPLSFLFFCCFTYFCLLFSVPLFSVFFFLHMPDVPHHLVLSMWGIRMTSVHPALTLFDILAWIIIAVDHV